MQTIDKGLSLLNLFSERHPEMGLSEVARCSGYNKATTRRFLVALEKHGLVEQDPTSRAYRLGPGVLRLARVREAVSPIESVVQPMLEQLADSLGETAHFSLYAGTALGTIGLVESGKSNRVMLGKGEVLPLHATASGLAYLAFAKPAFVKSVLGRSLEVYTDKTITDAQRVAELLQHVRRSGTAVAKSSYEDGVCGIASPVFAVGGLSCGAVAVAMPQSRAKRDVVVRTKREVLSAAVDITRAMGVEPAAAIIWLRQAS